MKNAGNNAWERLLVTRETSIIEAMKILEKADEKIVLVVDENRRLLGTVTDGDIRRGIIKAIGVNDAVGKIMHTNPITIGSAASPADCTRMMATNQIHQLPIVDSDGIAVGLATRNDQYAPRSRSNPVVVMAGGLGSRLEELTANCPKPMLKVGDKPMLETILENLIQYGFHDFYFSVNYMAEMIEDYFGDGSKWDISIRYLREKERMGTAGSLSLLPPLGESPVVVVNGDVLTKVNFSQLLENHTRNHYAASMCVRKYDFQVPFGVVQTNGALIKYIEEKPTQSFFVNAGIYVLNRSAVSMIPANSHFDMPALFNRIANVENLGAGVFPIHEYWLDVGRRDDFDRAQFEFSKVF